MSALALMRDLQAAGVVLEVRDGRLKVDAPAGLITAGIRDSLARHKAELLAMLAADPAEWCNWAPLDEPVAWTAREDVRLVVEDLHRERWHPRRIARELGLHLEEVHTILRRRR